jgi:type I restriction enzyme S subunit
MFVPDTPGVYKVYEQKNAINKDATLGHYYIDRDKYEELKGFAVLPYDIIVSCAGTIGETFILPQEIREGIINQALMLIRLFDRSITYFYLLYFDYILKNEAAKESKGTAIKNIPPFEVLKNFLIPIPPLAEQKRIANEVERWFAVVEALESNEGDLLKAIDQAKSKILDLAIHGKLVPQDPNDEPAIELLKRINPQFSHYDNERDLYLLPFNWQWCRLNDVCQIYGRIGFRGYTKEDLVPNNGAITLSPSNIIDGKMNYDNCTYISWEKYVESPEIQISEGDILLVKTGSSFGKCALVNELPQEATINPQFVVLKEINCNQKYLTFILQSQYARNNYDEFVLGTAIPTFTQVKLGNMDIPLPPAKEQLRIVAKIEELFAVLDSIKEFLE